MLNNGTGAGTINLLIFYDMLFMYLAELLLSSFLASHSSSVGNAIQHLPVRLI